MIALLAVIAAAATLTISGLGAIRSTGPAAQDSATRDSIDTVALAAGDYWLETGDGKIDIARICRYLNARFVARGSDLRLRTAAPVGGGGVMLPISASLTPDASQIPSGLARHVAWARDGDTPPMLPPARSPQEANCPASAASISVAASSDLLMSGQELQRPGVSLADPITGAQEWRGGTSDTSTGLGISRGETTAAGFSTQTVWFMQPTGFATGTDVPPGADIGSGSTLDENAVLIFGAVAPSGNSYCLVKVFKATDREHTGEYRFTHYYDPIRPRIATCTQGPGDGSSIPPGMTLNASWPG